MGTHPIFESDFDCLTDIFERMNLETVETLLHSSKGAALQDLIKQSLISPYIYHYESILTHTSVRALEESADLKKYYNVLKLFAYGTVTDYRKDKELIGWDLNESEFNKLKLLSIITLASKYHEVTYDSLLEMIGFENYQKLEEVLISGITSGIISGKMDQERKIFYVTSTIGRDVQLSDLSKMSQMTEAWATKTKGILVETVNMQKSEAAKEAQVKHDEKLLNEEIRSVKEALKLEQENRKSGMFTAKADTSEKFIRKDTIDMDSGEMKPKKYKLRGRKN